ncbi:MAG: aldose epimerase family protein [Microbacter sp.]
MNTTFKKTIANQHIDLYELQKGHLKMSVTNFGAKIVSLWVPDKNAKAEDVVLGFDNIDDYLTKEPFFGAVCGRFANRIKKGRFELDGKTYQLAVNNGANHLHGGNKGFNDAVWQVKEADASHIVLSHFSPDGEEGYPGNLHVTVTYELTDNNELKIHYEATTDQATIINLTQHSFFNLKGAGNGTIEDHALMVNADFYTPLDETQAPTGEIAAVNNTLMDFRQPVIIRDRIHADFNQFTFGRGIDNNWVIKKQQAHDLAWAASLHEPQSGRLMQVFTTQPGIQVYTGNWIENHIGKYGKSYDVRYAVCLETQGFPCAPNFAHFPTSVLRPHEKYDETTVYRFSIK